jgi:hypothetical protein
MSASIPRHPSPTGHASRFQELVSFVGRHGHVAIRQVMAELEVGRTAAYRRLHRGRSSGSPRPALLRPGPSAGDPRRPALRRPRLPLAPGSPGNVEHDLRCTTTAQLFPERYGKDQLLTERALVLADTGTIAIEVELTPKAPYRPQGLIRAWRRTTGRCVIENQHTWLKRKGFPNRILLVDPFLLTES